MISADVSISLPEGARNLNLQIFIDRSVLEVFVNDQACATKVIPTLEAGATLEIRSQNGAAQAKRIRCWPIKTIWPATAR